MRTLLAILLLHIFSLHAQQISFFNHDVSDGLPDNHIKSIIQDNKGFMWFGTQNGLARYDGYDLRIFRNEPYNPNSLSNNNIWCLLEGKSGYIWIGTRNGDLNMYDPEKDLFEKWNICNSKDEENYISCLYEHTDGSIWIGTYNKGLYRFNPENKSIQRWFHDPADKNSISNDFINAIVPDPYGNLWIGTYSGLNRFTPYKNNNLFEKYFADKALSNNLIWRIVRSGNPDILYIGTYKGVTILNTNSLTFRRIVPEKNPSYQFSNSIGSIIENSTDKGIELWLGSYGGLIKYNLQTKEKHHWHQNNTDGSLPSDQINDLCRDRSGVLWIATENGISRLPEKRFRFTNEELNTLSADDRQIVDEADISSVLQAKNGSIYLGTGKGLVCLMKSTGKLKVISIPQFKGMHIWSLEESSPNELWVGTYGNGLYKFDIITSAITKIEFASPTQRSTPYKYVKTIAEDKRGNVWVGFWGGGLAVIDGKSGNKKIFRKDDMTPQAISFNDVWKICEDSFGRIWIGTNGGGLNLYSEKNGGTFIKVNGINNNSILSICEQKSNTVSGYTYLWIGTNEGLSKLEIKNAMTNTDFVFNVKNYSAKKGLFNSVITGIAEDSMGELWLTTNFGLTRFSPDSEEFVTFSSFDGLTCNNFGEGALFSGNDRNILAGGKGFNIFNPGEISLSDYQPKVVFTDLLIHNKQIRVSGDSHLDREIAYTSGIELEYNENTFTLCFSALDFNSPDLIDYAYKLEGLDEEWKFSRSQRAVYTNVSPGKYVFNVRATNSDNVWQNTPTQLLINVNPPWWKTYWAYTFYIFLIILGFIELRRFQISRTKLWQELRMHELEARKLQELENLKSRFFANLSHEFRTPLMLIKGPVEQLLKNNKDSEDSSHLAMISRNTQKLQELIDQLLELSQLEACSIPLKLRKENLVLLIGGIVSSFESIAAQKNLRLIFNHPEELYLWIDRDKLEKIINNLLSNAFKFTESGGSVSVSLDVIETSQVAEIIISDTGIGIPLDHQEKIFNRFYQVDDSTRRAFGGSGIGLALVKELVELHKLKIDVLSEPGKGTSFILTIPMNETYSGEEIKFDPGSSGNENVFEIQAEVETYEESNSILHKATKRFKETNSDKSVILIIDDSSDVREYLQSILDSEYIILQAENGERGMCIAVGHMPDLIICDVMMPVMDGIEFCRQIKSNWETSHIPVILLTAKASFENRIEGLDTGADVYLTKPFASKELITQINNLTEQRKRLKEKFSREIKISPASVTTTSLDNEFLEKACRVVEENLSKMDFDTEAFASQMFVSRSQLHRKILVITGLAPGEFLRTFRLKKAAQMLSENHYSITQISFEVGFSSPSHFAKAFHKQFKCLPSEFHI